MMKTLITPVKVIEIAFTDCEFIPPQTIGVSDIASAEERYIVPVIGQPLYEKLLSGYSPDFVTEYLSAPVALFTRLTVQSRLDIRTGQCGTTAPRPSDSQPASAEALREMQRTLRREARTLLRRASEYLDAHTSTFPQYDPDNNILKRCSIDGNFIQTP
jgi:hypothetical protein